MKAFGLEDLMRLKSANAHVKRTYCIYEGCGGGVVRSRMFLGGVGFLTTLGVGVGFFCPVFLSTPSVQLDHFLNHTLKLGIPVEMLEFLLTLLLKQKFLAVNHDFH